MREKKSANFVFFSNPKYFFFCRLFLLLASSSSSVVLFIFLSLGVQCEIEEGIRGGFVSLSLVERKTVKKRRGFSLFAVVLGFCGFCCRAKGV